MAYLAAVPVLTVAAAATSSAFVGGHRVVAAGALRCGFERWGVKTLSDPVGRTANFSLRQASVRLLRKLPSLQTPPTGRLRPVETTAAKIEVQLVEMKLEGDQDIHLVVRQPDGGAAETVIVSSPPAPAPPLRIKHADGK